MGLATLPVHVSCARTTIGLGSAGTPTMSLSLDISIPLEELFRSLEQLQTSTLEKPMERQPEAVDIKMADMKATSFLLSEDEYRVQAPSPFSAPLRRAPGEVVPMELGMAPQQDSDNKIPKHPPALEETDGQKLDQAFAGVWESLPQGQTVRVMNLLKGVKSKELRSIFEREIGPVHECMVSADCQALVAFNCAEHATKATEDFDGAILEVSEALPKSDSARTTLVPNNSGTGFRQRIESFLGPLSQTHFRRGERWMTLGMIAPAKDKQEYKVDYKGSFISVVLAQLPS